jgi:hypothetical protein
MHVYLVWHVSHARNLDGTPTQHMDDDGHLRRNEDRDDVELVGVYSTKPLTEERRLTAS